MHPTTLVSSYQAGLKYDVATTRKSPSFLLSTFCIFAKFVSSSSSSLKKGERERFVSDECERWVDPASTFRGTRGILRA